MTKTINDLMERFAEEADACEADGSATREWFKAREIPTQELRAVCGYWAEVMLMGQMDLPSVLTQMFRLGYELAVERERSSPL